MIRLVIDIIVLMLLCCLCASALSVSVHVSERYADVNAGERIYFEVDVKYPENPGRRDIQLIYEITDMDDDLVARSKVVKAIETQASFIDFIVLPENVEEGTYSINVRIADEAALAQGASATFNVISHKADNLTPYFLVIAIALAVVLVLAVFNMVFLKELKARM